MPEDFNFPDIISGPGEKVTPTTFIGHKSVKDAGGKYVPLQVLNSVARGDNHLYMWGWVEYGDIFRKSQRSRSEFCFEVAINGDITKPPTDLVKPPFDFVACAKHNGSEDECYRRAGDVIPILRLP
jgi:hypothetical protein